jgi:type IV pilus assembly protein PilA
MTQSNRRRGFTLMELMIVIAIVLVMLVIAIPNVAAARMQANELAAIKMIGTIHTAQVQHLSQFGKLATALSELGPPPAGAELLPGDLAIGKKSGYLFQLQRTPAGYSVTAIPESHNSTGRRTFYSDQTMVIRESADPASKEIAN